MNDIVVRPDLLAAQQRAWRDVTSPGASWTGAERAAIAATALAALDDGDPLPPWVSATTSGRELPGDGVLPSAVADATYRIARHAATLTQEWYDAQLELGIDPFAYVEMVAIISAVAAVDGFYRASGLLRPPLPATIDGDAHGRHPDVESTMLNWVPVAVPADVKAAVVQGLTAAPDDCHNIWRLAAAQYIPADEMGEMRWSRGTLARSDMELVAARLSASRECFY